MFFTYQKTEWMFQMLKQGGARGVGSTVKRVVCYSFQQVCCERHSTVRVNGSYGIRTCSTLALEERKKGNNLGAGQLVLSVRKLAFQFRLSFNL